MSVITKNMREFIAFVGDGEADDGPAFNDFNTWALLNQRGDNAIRLIIPEGAICRFETGTDGGGSTFAMGIRHLTVIGEGSGATLYCHPVTGYGFHLGGRGVYPARAIDEPDGISARIETVAAGATSIRLTAYSMDMNYLDRVAVGDWLLVGGYDLQGYGQPPNPAFCDFIQIIAIDKNAGEITFAEPLTNEYKSHWPLYNPGKSIFEPDLGGPGTIWKLDTFDTTLEYRNLIIDQDGGQTLAKGKDVTYRNCIIRHGPGVIPTCNKVFRLIDCQAADEAMEIDKMVGRLEIIGTTIYRLHFQTAINEFVMDNSIVTGFVRGGGRLTTITNSTIAEYRPSVNEYGYVEQVSVSDSEIAYLDNTFGTTFAYLDTEFTMAEGVITVPHGKTVTDAQDNGQGKVRLTLNSTAAFSTGLCPLIGGIQGTIEANGRHVITVVDDEHLDLLDVDFVNEHIPGGTNHIGGYVPLPWGAPGVRLVWRDAYIAQPYSFTITDQTQDADATYVHTDAAGGFPPLLTPNGTRYDIAGTPVQYVTFRNVTGCPDVADLSGAPADMSLWSYSKRTYTGDTDTAPLSPMFGKLVSIKFNVSTPYAGEGPLSFIFDPWWIDGDTIVRLDGTMFVDATRAGERVVTPDTIAGSGDLLGRPPGNVFLVPGSGRARFSRDIRGDDEVAWPVVTLEIITDH